MINLNREELAWAAGFFDGEGSTGFSKNGSKNHQNHLRIQIWQANLLPLERFQKAVGGIGKIYGPYEKEGSGKVHWMFSVDTFQGVQAVIALLWNWLCVIKRTQAREKLAEFHKSRRIEIDA